MSDFHKNGSTYLPIRYAGLLYQCVQQRVDISTQQFFSNTVIPTQRIHEQGYYIGFQDFKTACDHATILAGSSSIAMDFGKSLVLPAHGTWGLAAMTSPTLQDALIVFMESATLDLPFFTFDYQEVDEHAIVVVKGTPDIEDRLQFHLEYLVVAAAINFLYAMKDSSDLEIHCDYNAPAYHSLYREIIGRDVIFNSSFTGIRFHRKHLTVEMPDANLASNIMLKKTLAEERIHAKSTRTVTSIIIDHLNSTPRRYPNQETIAKLFNVSIRKLRYSLQDENTNYKAIIMNFKKRDALNCLNEGMSISQAAIELGYDDSSNFTRAFRKWYGVSPSLFQTIRCFNPI